MAKFTKKIRISEYDVNNNEFKISFELAGNDEFPFQAVFNSDNVLDLENSSAAYLSMIGVSEFYTRVIIDEIFQWLSKPRKSLDGFSHLDTMHSRFEVTKRLEAERRATAAVKRIIAEAPCLDWAMSVMDEMEAEEEAVAGGMRQPKRHAFKIVPPGCSQKSRAEDEARYQARRKVAEDATDKAVNVIHNHALRFVMPMSMREHDFLRTIIKEEIEKVVGGVL